MELREAIYTYLQSQHLMALATHSESTWIANVYFLVDQDLNIYFMSSPHTEHRQDISKNSQVAIAVSDSSKKPNEAKSGLQLTGNAEVVEDAIELGKVILSWNQRFSVIGGNPITLENITNLAHSRLYRIKPTRIKYYNTDLWPEEKFKVWEISAN